MERKLYEHIALKLHAAYNCSRANNKLWMYRHLKAIDELVRDHLPSGSGFDSGTKFDDSSTPNRLVFNTSFHHMDDSGGYNGWTEHQVIVNTSLAFGFELRITGRNRNDIKDYIHEVFQQALSSYVDDAAVVSEVAAE